MGNTNEKSIFFISDVVPFTDKYVEREYLNKTKRIHIIKNKILLSDLEYKLKRILEFENRKTKFISAAHYRPEKISDKRTES